MSAKVCFVGNALHYPQGGGYLWIYLNWALGLRALGCEVVWLERFAVDDPPAAVRAQATGLRERLERYGLGTALALCGPTGEPLEGPAEDGWRSLEETADADLLLNIVYGLAPEVVARFRRSALIDIDPGLLQLWMDRSWIEVAPHDVYFSIGETVGRSDARFPSGDIDWQYTPPPVSLDCWPLRPATSDGAFTTVTQWGTFDEWMEDDEGEVYSNDKRDGFLPFLELPRRTGQPLELALGFIENQPDEAQRLRRLGWGVRPAEEVSATPWDYQTYVAGSLGEFSCAKPSCMRLANAWVSDRTLGYLASGRPAVVQHTGPSRFLPDREGLFRFRNLEEAARYLEAVASDYEGQQQRARALAEEYFDARKVVASVLERALA